MSAKELIQYAQLKPTETERQLREVFEDIGSFGVGLTPQDVDALAEFHAEARVFPLSHPNFHDQ